MADTGSLIVEVEPDLDRFEALLRERLDSVLAEYVERFAGTAGDQANRPQRPCGCDY